MTGLSIDQLIEQLNCSSNSAEKGVILKVQELYQKICQIPKNEQQSVFNRIFETNVIGLLNVISRQDFGKINGKWKTAYMISCFIGQLCRFVCTVGQMSVTRQELIQELFESQLIQLRRIQKKYVLIRNQSSSDSSGIIRSSSNAATTKSDLIKIIHLIVQNICQSTEESGELTLLLVNSPWFLQLLVADEEEITVIFVDTLTACLKRWPDTFGKLKYDQKIDILDELMYQIAVLDGADAITHTLECLLTIIETTPHIRPILLKRYHGIQLLLSKWASQFLTRFKSSNLSLDQQNQFNQMIAKLIDYVGPYRSKSSLNLADENDENVCEQRILTENQAAVIIQSYWRGYMERFKLKRIDQAFATFQRQFRERQSTRKRLAREQRMEAELTHFVQTARHQRYRERLEAEAKLWESLPVVLFRKQLANQKQWAAICIQKFYRGYRVRSDLSRNQIRHKQNKAACTIQRAFRRYVSRKECLFVMKPRVEGTSPDGGVYQIDLVEARKKHRGWCETQLKSSKLADECPIKLHNDIQIRLHQYYRGELDRKNEDQAREVSLARCQMNAELLLSEFNQQSFESIPNSSCPVQTNLSNLVSRYEQISSHESHPKFDKFFCRVQPLARLAQIEHRECRLNLEKPWWDFTMRQYRHRLNEWCQAHEFNVTTDTNKQHQQQDSLDQNKALGWLPDQLFDQISYMDEYLYMNKV